MRGGGELLSVTIEPGGDYLGRTWHRTKVCAPGDRMFVTFAGPWAEARCQWPLPSLDGEDTEGAIFDDYLLAAWMRAADGDHDVYEDMRAHDVGDRIVIAEHLGITPGELRDREERGWADELEQAWPVIQQVAGMLLAGETVGSPSVS